MHRSTCGFLLSLLLTAGLLAGCSTSQTGQATASGAPGADISGVYTANFSSATGHANVTLDLRQRGARLSGTYTRRSAGEEITGSVTGTYSGAQLSLIIRTPEPTEFAGTVSEDGSEIQGRLSEGFSDSYTITFTRN